MRTFRFPVLTIAYALIGAIIVALAVTMYSIIDKVSHEQAGAASVINIAGRQRMLSQRISMLCAAYVRSDDLNDREELIDAVRLMARQHKMLTQPSPNSPDQIRLTEPLRQLYFKQGLDQDVLDFISTAVRIANEVSDDPKEDLKTIETLARDYLLQKLDNAVSLYQADSEQTIEKLKSVERILMAILAISILTELLLIVLPLIKSLKSGSKDLERSKQTLDIALESANLGIWQFNSVTQELTLDTTAARLLLEQKEAIALPLERTASIIGQDALSQLTKTLEQANADGALISCTLKFNRRNQTPVQLVLKGRSVSQVKNEGASILGVIEDTTNQARMTDTIEQAKQAAEAEAVRISEFLSSMSHELRTPLNAVMGFAHLLENKNYPPQVQDVGVKIVRSVKSLTQIINDVLDLSRLDAGKLEIASARFTLYESLENLGSIMSASAAKRDIDVIINPQCDLYKQLLGDALRIEQVLINLMSNAIKFTRVGRVELDIQTLASNTRLTRLQFSVRDSGIGMNRQTLSRIMQPFSQANASTSKQFGGSGLGLTICQRLLALMGSKLEIESKEGQGSHFSFVIDLKTETSIQATGGASEKLQIAIVGDNHALLDGANNTANAMHWSTDRYDNLPDALAAALEKANYGLGYDAVLLEWTPANDEQTQQFWRAIEDFRANPLSGKTRLIALLRLQNQPAFEAQNEQGWVDSVLEQPVTPMALRDRCTRTIQAASGAKNP